ncbi:MAG: 2-oxo acid dehydrogenase subunit E2 [Candidatus Heimdallarchaeota archaeon]|nr:2-oxo acid dehydrogenase subunit E2 [Candidatus Heimdallarchaeota archaeon]
MKSPKDYHKRKFSVNRQILADYNAVAASFSRIQGLIETDVTEALKIIKTIEKKDGYKVSFTAWVAKCISKAVSEDKRLNSYRKGRRKIIVFDKIDISIMVEITTKEGKQVPFNYVVRDVESKSVKEISDEIRAVQQKKIEEREQLTRGSSKFSNLYLLIPGFIRRGAIKYMLTNPFRLRKLIGTVGITSLGKFVKNLSGWAVPFADKTLTVALGGMKKVVCEIEGKLQTKEYLCVTYMMNHDLVDGAPAARFISRCTELMETNYCLGDIEKTE